MKLSKKLKNDLSLYCGQYDLECTINGNTILIDKKGYEGSYHSPIKYFYEDKLSESEIYCKIASWVEGYNDGIVEGKKIFSNTLKELVTFHESI